MKRLTCWLLIGSLTFMLGVAATIVWVRSYQPAAQKSAPPPCAQSLDVASNPADSPILSYCELATNPEKYNGKIVRVSTRLAGFIHGMYVSDPNCTGVDMSAAVTFDPQNREEIERRLSQARGSDNWLEPVDLIVIGRFQKVIPSNGSDTIYDTAPLQFEIMSVEKASKPR